MIFCLANRRLLTRTTYLQAAGDKSVSYSEPPGDKGPKKTEPIRKLLRTIPEKQNGTLS